MKGQPYYIGFTRKFNGLGVELRMDPPWAMVRISWIFTVRLGWFLFWYIQYSKK